MGVLAWLLVPFLVTAAAFLVVGFRQRPDRPVQGERGMEDLNRLRQAMTRPMPAPEAPAERPATPAPTGVREIDLRPSRKPASAA